MPIMPYIRAIFWLLTGLSVAIGVRQVLVWREGSIETERLRKAESRTTAIINDGTATSENRRRADAHVAITRRAYDHSLAEAVANDPEIAYRNGQPVPPRLLELAKARRVARERLGCASGDCGRGTSSEVAE